MGEESFTIDESTFNCDKCRDKGTYISKGKVHKCSCPVALGGRIVTDEEQVEKKKELLPPEYSDITLNTDLIRTDVGISEYIKSDSSFSYYLDMLDEIYNRINIREKLKTSLMLSAPQGFGKAHFVYACINACIRNGTTVAPYLDSLEIYELIKRTTSNHTRDIDSEETLEQIYTSEICFIKIPTGLTINANTTQTIKLITDRRSRRGLPTIVMSRFPVNYIYTTEMNLDRFILTRNFGNLKHDYSRLRLITSPHVYGSKNK